MKKPLFRQELPHIHTIVVKIGSRILSGPGHSDRVKSLAKDIITLQKNGLRIILVSSGAIAHGMNSLGLQNRPTTIPLQQACASIGQNRLMSMYENAFNPYKVLIGQVLLTWDDLRSKKRYLNLRNTMFQLLACDVIPIVNENDSVGIEEIQFGNNDMLAAQVALLIQADIFVNLTDVGGLYDKNPQIDKLANYITVINSFSASVHNFASDKKKQISVGGMATKLKAAEIVSRAGIFALIGDGFNQSLSEVLNNQNSATLFIPSERKMSSRHRWIAFTGHAKGSIFIDNGALRAIVEKGKSILPAGINNVYGFFKAGDKIEVKAENGQTIAAGLVNYSAEEICLIKGCKTSQINSKLGRKSFDEVIHRDNLVLLNP